MKNTAIVFTLLCAIATAAVIAAQSSADDERRDAIRLLRAINTAENAFASRNARKHATLPELMEHPQMGGVKPDMTVSGSGVSYKGAQVRLALSADGTQYVVTVVSPSGVAAFTDERGIIYTGKALE